jgi:hypothetical protein
LHMPTSLHDRHQISSSRVPCTWCPTPSHALVRDQSFRHCLATRRFASHCCSERSCMLMHVCHFCSARYLSDCFRPRVAAHLPTILASQQQLIKNLNRCAPFFLLSLLSFSPLFSLMIERSFATSTVAATGWLSQAPVRPQRPSSSPKVAPHFEPRRFSSKYLYCFV